MDAILAQARQVAVQAAVAAGQIHRSLFEQVKEVKLKGDDGDVVTEADWSAEKAILDLLHRHFPDHAVRSEETGWSGVDSDWLWLVDPLDGTNNFAIGLPLFGVSLTLLYKRETMLGVIYDSVLQKLYVAERGKGASCNGKPLQFASRKSPQKLRTMTISWIQGHRVQRQAQAMQLRHHLEERFKRVMRVWAPTIVWASLAAANIDGVVLYNSEGDDLYAGLLLAKEAGASIIDFDGNDFVGMNEEPYLIACHPDHKEQLLAVVREGLGGALVPQ